jgi:molybdate transport system regulatory protein
LRARDNTGSTVDTKSGNRLREESMNAPESHAGLVSPTPKKSIDPVKLQVLERAFRSWADAPSGIKRKLSRKRILLIFLLIRYTGARLNEILSLDPLQDFDFRNHKVFFRKAGPVEEGRREVQIPELLEDEIKNTLDAFDREGSRPGLFKVDPAHVRRKFYDRAEAAGIRREWGTPEAVRRSRAVELMQSNVPLPVVQKIMGHSTPNLAASYVEFSDEEIRNAERFHVERENKRLTSARNSFFGKIDQVQAGDVQAAIEFVSVEGHRIHSTVTNFSRSRLGLKPGRLAAAEVKAPWVVLYTGAAEPACSAENRFKGSVLRVLKGKVNSEVVVRISSRTELCAVVTEQSRKMLGIEKGDSVWAVFNAAMVVIHVD